MNVDQDVLIELRDQVISSAMPLVEDQSLPAEKRFSMLMTIIEADPSIDLLRKAFSVAQSIESPVVRADALLDVVDEIDLLLEASTVVEPSTEIVEA